MSLKTVSFCASARAGPEPSAWKASFTYSCAGLGVSLFCFSYSTSLWLSVALLLPAGYSMMLQMACSNTLIQTMVPDELRGRVMSVYSMMFMGMAPFGAFFGGALAHRFGAPITVATGGIACVFGAIWFARALPDMRVEARRLIIAQGMAAGEPATRRCRAICASSASSPEFSAMPRMSMVEAIRDAMDCKMAEDERVVVFGEDVGYFGGVFRCTDGLQRKYGKSRCFDAPINESGIVGVAIGMGAYGLRAVAEIQFADDVYPGYDQIVSEAARLRYRSGGEFFAPIVLRMPCGGESTAGRPTARARRLCSPTSPASRPSSRPTPTTPRVFSSPRSRMTIRSSSRAEAALQRSVRRPPRAAYRALGQASFERSAGGALCRPARKGRDPARGEGGHGPLLWHDDPCRRGRGGGDRD